MLLRGFVRPLTDAVGMLCTVWSLGALERHLATGSRAAGSRLFLLQTLGLFARPSFIPVLGMPVLARLLGAGTLAERLRRALGAGLLFGAGPAIVYAVIVLGLGIEHTTWMWQSAHQAQYIPPDRLRALLSSLSLAGGVYLVVGALATLDARWRPRRRCASTSRGSSSTSAFSTSAVGLSGRATSRPSCRAS